MEEEEQVEVATMEESGGETNLSRFEVTSWRGVATWSWTPSVDNCAICRNHIMELCIECQATSQSASPSPEALDECTVTWGVCNHSFHYHCISRFIRLRRVCPLDNREWAYLRYKCAQAHDPPGEPHGEAEPTG